MVFPSKNGMFFIRTRHRFLSSTTSRAWELWTIWVWGSSPLEAAIIFNALSFLFFCCSFSYLFFCFLHSVICCFFHSEFPLMFGLILRLLTRGVSWLEFSMGQCTCSSQPHIDSYLAAQSPRKGHAFRGRGCATRQIWALQFGYSSHMRNDQIKTMQDNSFQKSISNNMLK